MFAVKLNQFAAENLKINASHSFLHLIRTQKTTADKSNQFGTEN